MATWTTDKTGLLPALGGVVIAASVIAAGSLTLAQGPSRDEGRRHRFSHNGVLEDEAPAAGRRRAAGANRGGTTEAPTGFDNRTNGFSPQGPPFDSIDEDNVVPLRSFNDNRFIFEEAEMVADGLRPT